VCLERARERIECSNKGRGYPREITTVGQWDVTVGEGSDFWLPLI
jgi:hypothetical protein